MSVFGVCERGGRCFCCGVDDSTGVGGVGGEEIWEVFPGEFFEIGVVCWEVGGGGAICEGFGLHGCMGGGGRQDDG